MHGKYISYDVNHKSKVIKYIQYVTLKLYYYLRKQLHLLSMEFNPNEYYTKFSLFEVLLIFPSYCNDQAVVKQSLLTLPFQSHECTCCTTNRVLISYKICVKEKTIYKK